MNEASQEENWNLKIRYSVVNDPEGLLEKTQILNYVFWKNSVFLLCFFLARTADHLAKFRRQINMKSTHPICGQKGEQAITTKMLQAHPLPCDYTTWTRNWDAEQTAEFYIHNNGLCSSVRHNLNVCPHTLMPRISFTSPYHYLVVETFKNKIIH